MPPRCPSSAGFANCSADGMFGIHGGQEERRAMPDLMLYEAMKTRSTVHNAKEIEPIVHVFIGYSQISLRVLNLWRNTLQKKQQANILYKFIYIYIHKDTLLDLLVRLRFTASCGKTLLRWRSPSPRQRSTSSCDPWCRSPRRASEKIDPGKSVSPKN